MNTDPIEQLAEIVHERYWESPLCSVDTPYENTSERNKARYRRAVVGVLSHVLGSDEAVALWRQKLSITVAPAAAGEQSSLHGMSAGDIAAVARYISEHAELLGITIVAASAPFELAELKRRMGNIESAEAARQAKEREATAKPVPPGKRHMWALTNPGAHGILPHYRCLSCGLTSINRLVEPCPNAGGGVPFLAVRIVR